MLGKMVACWTRRSRFGAVYCQTVSISIVQRWNIALNPISQHGTQHLIITDNLTIRLHISLIVTQDDAFSSLVVVLLLLLVMALHSSTHRRMQAA